MWYIGIANVTTNSVEVIGDANVDFVNNVEPGDAFICTGNGLTLEVLRAESRNKLVLARPYTGPTGSFAFSVQPTQDFNRVTANAIIDLRNTYGGYRDTILQGMFPDGSAAAPGMRFIGDQDTGLRRYAANVISAVCGGVDAALFGPDGTSFSAGGSRIAQVLAAGLGMDTGKGIFWEGNTSEALIPSDGVAGWLWKTDGRILIQYQNGTAKMVVDTAGNLGVGTATPLARMHVLSSNTTLRVESTNAGATDTQIAIVTPNRQWNIGQNVGGSGIGALNFFDVTAGSNRMTLDKDGNLLVGQPTGGRHTFSRATTEGDDIFYIANVGAGGVTGFAVGAVNGQGWSGAKSAFYIGRNANTGRSINAGGTINANGADYAEYETKAAGCGTIAAGDVCGVDRDGRLTDRWADAIVFRIKSTNPSMVGGDTWSAHLGSRPEAPSAEPTAPALPGPAPVEPVEPGPEPTEEGPAYVAWLQARFAYAVQLSAYETALAMWQAATAAYPGARAQFEADHAAWVAATAAYERDLPIYEAALEEARQKVDRIAYCGKVPVNMTDPVEPGDYLIAAQDGDRINAVAVKEADMTLALYMKRLGRVLFIRDGRPWVDVQHG